MGFLEVAGLLWALPPVVLTRRRFFVHGALFLAMKLESVVSHPEFVASPPIGISTIFALIYVQEIVRKVSRWNVHKTTPDMTITYNLMNHYPLTALPTHAHKETRPSTNQHHASCDTLSLIDNETICGKCVLGDPRRLS